MDTCKECERYREHTGSSNDVMFCKEHNRSFLDTKLRDCTHFTPKKPEEKKAHKTVASVYTYKPGKATWANKKACDKWKKTKPKENKMNRLKKWARRYVMGCTLWGTAVICIALNPWVCKLWQILPVNWESCPSIPVFSWGFTFLSITAIVLAIYVFEKATAFAFGKLEK